MDLNIITGDKPKRFDKFYQFTNENLTSYEGIIDFAGSSILSVVGSGDQYFSSLLFGSEKVDLFDINTAAIYYFILKFVAIRILSYDEFMDFFLNSKFSKIEIYNKIRTSLPKEVREYFDEIYRSSSIEAQSYLTLGMRNYENTNTGRIIPYFERKQYYILKRILNNIDFPKFYAMDLLELPKHLEKNTTVCFYQTYLGI